MSAHQKGIEAANDKLKEVAQLHVAKPLVREMTVSEKEHCETVTKEMHREAKEKLRDRVVWCSSGWQPVAIGFCPSEQAWNREMKRLNGAAAWPMVPNAGGHTQWLKNDKTNEAVILVCVHPASERDALQVIMTIVHEAVHVWQFLCEHIGEKAPGIEMEAYGIENIARGLIDAYCSTQGKGKNWL